jgi:hypothetical protein
MFVLRGYLKFVIGIFFITLYINKGPFETESSENNVYGMKIVTDKAFIL